MKIKFNIFGFSIIFLMVILVMNTIALIILYNTPIKWFLVISLFYYECCLLEVTYSKEKKNNEIKKEGR